MVDHQKRDDDLEEAVRVARRAVLATSKTSVAMPGHLTTLAIRLSAWYEATGDLAVLKEAVTTARGAVRAIPDTSPDLPAAMSNLAILLGHWYNATGSLTHVTRAVLTARAAVRLTPVTSADMPNRLNNLANHLSAWYFLTGERTALQEAVAAAEGAVRFSPDTSTDLPGLMGNLSCRLGDWYVATGDRAALEEAVATARAAVQSTPDTSARRPGELNNLAILLGDWYVATGDRAALEEAVAAARRAVEAIPATSADLPSALNTLAVQLGEWYQATGDRAALEEAVTAARAAVQATPDSSPTLPVQLNNFAAQLNAWHAATGDQAALEEAVAAARAAVQGTPDTSTSLPGHLNNLASHLSDWHARSGDHTVLEEVVKLARRAVQATPDTSTELPSHLINLASHLGDWYTTTGDQSVFQEAEQSLDRAAAASRPWDQVQLASRRAGLSRLDTKAGGPDYRAAVRALQRGLEAFEIERQRLAGNAIGLRDLSHRLDGMLADLCANLVLAGDTAQAIDTLTRSRIWLTRSPRATESRSGESPDDGSVAVAWVLASQWETVTITQTGSANPRHHTLPVPRRQVARAIFTALNATRDRQASVGERCAALDAACDLTSQISATFPDTERLLIIPLGICSQLPYAAAAHAAGGYLIDHTDITLAPTFDWAQAANHPKPSADPTSSVLAVFHPGEEAHRLDLADDITMAEQVLHAAPLVSPTAEQVLARLTPDTVIGHFSCHGSYNHTKPLDSALMPLGETRQGCSSKFTTLVAGSA